MRRTRIAAGRPSLSPRALTMLSSLLLAAPLLGACSSFNKAFKIQDEPPAHREPSTTSIYGDWVLATPPDSTAFAGASLVELNLAPSSFTITAAYPHAATTIVRGSLGTTDGAAHAHASDEHAERPARRARADRGAVRIGARERGGQHDGVLAAGRRHRRRAELRVAPEGSREGGRYPARHEAVASPSRA